MADNKFWWNNLPHSEFSIRNIDWLISKYGEYDYRIGQIEESDKEQNETLENHEERLTEAESDIVALEMRLTTAEGDIDAVEGRCDSLETTVSSATSDIDSLKERMTTAEGDIDAVEGRCGSLESRMTTAEGDIDTVEDAVSSMYSSVQRNTNDITALDGRVDSLEEHSVIANQGGATSAILSTLAVDGVNYEVPQSGGGGGGSTVIPNASGTPTADLTSLGVDGYVYAIPTGVDTSDLIAEEYDPTDYYDTGDLVIYDGTLYRAIDDSITGAWDSNKWVETTVAEECQNASSTATSVYNMYADLGTAYERTVAAELDTRASGKDTLPGVNINLTPGSWIVTFNVTFDTHLLGSKQRLINIYVDDSNDNNLAQFGKYMWGSEAITGVLYENSCSLSVVVDVPYGTTKTIYGKVAARVNTGSGSYDVSAKLGAVRIKPYSA